LALIKLPKLAKTRFTKSYHKWLLNIPVRLITKEHMAMHAILPSYYIVILVNVFKEVKGLP